MSPSGQKMSLLVENLAKVIPMILYYQNYTSYSKYSANNDMYYNALDKLASDCIVTKQNILALSRKYIM